MKVLVLGASANPSRYAYLAINDLIDYGHEVIAIGRSSAIVRGVKIIQEKIPNDSIDTVTVYLNPTNQKEYETYILQIAPKRVIFNPGSENPLFATRLLEAGIEVINACTLVMLRTNQF